METVAGKLDKFYNDNKFLLEERTKNQIKAGKCIFRPISVHIHDLIDQFEHKISFNINKPNKITKWASKGPSTWSQKRRVFTCFGLTREEEKDGLNILTLSEEGRSLVSEYFKNEKKYKQNTNAIPNFIKKFYIKKIIETNINNINIGTNTILCGLRYIVNENFFYNLNIGTSKKFNSFIEKDTIKGYYYKYFNYEGDSGDLLDWVKGILAPLGIIEKTNLKSSEILDITDQSAKKISVWSLTDEGINLVNSLSILKDNFKKFESESNQSRLPEVKTPNIIFFTKEEYQLKRSKIPKAKKIVSRKLDVYKNKFETTKNILNRKQVNPEHSKAEIAIKTVTHTNTLADAQIYLNSKGFVCSSIDGNVDLWFKLKNTCHIFEIKSYAFDIHATVRKGLIQLQEYAFQSRNTYFKNCEIKKNLLFSKDPLISIRAYPHLIGFIKDLNIGLCYMKDKKIVWHKDFKNNDPFLKN